MKIADNEEYVIVEADNVEQAKDKIRNAITCSECGSNDTYVEEIHTDNIGLKIGELRICNNCKSAKRVLKQSNEE
ncbi:hypothetical protein [Staphylococcus xylosus]|uniref:hypothetical protein n=1 Tax=Staphylococcus xylosus TaxID=1288 RepID=UPI0011580EF8|nr:hypothetical protein [Staphylococcus xylosus]